MNDHARRYASASENVRKAFLTPVIELLQATTSFCDDANQRAFKAETTLDVLQTAAKKSLGEIYEILNVDNHADAVRKLREIVQ